MTLRGPAMGVLKKLTAMLTLASLQMDIGIVWDKAR